MNKLLIASLLVLPLYGQDTLVPNPTTYLTKAGSTISIPFTLNLTGQPDTNITAIDIGLSLPPGFAVTGVSLPASLTNKQLTCTPNQSRCIVWGPNAANIPNGPFVTFKVLVPPTATGSNQITFSNLEASDATGNINPVIGTGPIVQISSGQDLNGDGKVDTLDLKIMIDEILGNTACTDDQNGDGKCTIKDHMIILLKLLSSGGD